MILPAVFIMIILLFLSQAAESFSNFKVKSSKIQSKLYMTETTPKAALPRIDFEYCTGCRWMLRSAYMAQELLTTFEKEIGEVALIPSRGLSGTFTVRINGEVIWDRKANGGFPEIKELKQLVRDKIDPNKSLGHSDKVITL